MLFRSGQDVQLRGSNGFYLTQAINTGGAVNSFVVDWQVPFWATASENPAKSAMTVANAPFTKDTEYAVGRIQSAFESVSTGVWEVPGALYTDDTRAYVAANAPGAKPANEAAETETQLRLFMFARVSSTNFATAGNVFVEQNGNVERDRENFALAGSEIGRAHV